MFESLGLPTQTGLRRTVSHPVPILPRTNWDFDSFEDYLRTKQIALTRVRGVQRRLHILRHDIRTKQALLRALPKMIEKLEKELSEVKGEARGYVQFVAKHFPKGKEDTLPHKARTGRSGQSSRDVSIIQSNEGFD